MDRQSTEGIVKRLLGDILNDISVDNEKCSEGARRRRAAQSAERRRQEDQRRRDQIELLFERNGPQMRRKVVRRKIGVGEIAGEGQERKQMPRQRIAVRDPQHGRQ